MDLINLASVVLGV